MSICPSAHSVVVLQQCAALVEQYGDDEAAAGLLGAVDAVACKLGRVGRCLGCNVPTNFLFECGRWKSPSWRCRCAGALRGTSVYCSCSTGAGLNLLDGNLTLNFLICKWYFSSLVLTYEAFQLARSIFSFQAEMIGQKFNRISIDFLQYKNGSKFFYDLLRPIPTYTEGPQIFKKIVIALLCIVCITNIEGNSCLVGIYSLFNGTEIEYRWGFYSTVVHNTHGVKRFFPALKAFCQRGRIY